MIELDSDTRATAITPA